MDWTRGHTIGRGSSGTVSVATSWQTGEIFAVKSVELSESKFLQREQKILSILSNPYIVSYKGYDTTKENNKLMYNLWMEYVSGGTLTDAIRDRGGRLDKSMIGYYTCQIVQGLEYLHTRGIVHCDIKGRNILIGQRGAKIADLGCAKWVNSVIGTSDQAVDTVVIGGTPMFMAPEVACGEEQGFPADIWALGCTIIEMATGGSPWPNVTDPLSTLYQIAFSGKLPESPDFVSYQTKDFLEKCLRSDPKERWTAKQLLKHPFLEEFNLNSHKSQIQDSNKSSPTSILDQGIWNEIEEESENLVDLDCTCSLNSPGQRIGRLSLDGGGANWRWEETWITIRSNRVEHGGEAEADCGSVTALVGDETKLESAVGVEESINFVDSNVSCRNSSRNMLVACTCI